MNISETIRDFILENFMFNNNPDQLNDTQSFLETGIIDSTGILELVSFIEEQYNIIIEDEELIPDNLDSVTNVVNYIEKKLNST